MENSTNNFALITNLNLALSKLDVKTFHLAVRTNILATGNNLFEYIEILKFFEKVLKFFNGDSQAKNPEEREGDKELKAYILEEIKKYGKEFTTPRGVKFGVMENAGTKYHYENVGDPVLVELLAELEIVTEKVKERQEFLKNVPASGQDIMVEGGEITKVYPPYKTSTTTFKVTFPKS